MHTKLLGRLLFVGQDIGLSKLPRTSLTSDPQDARLLSVQARPAQPLSMPFFCLDTNPMQAHSNMGPQDHRNNKAWAPAPMFICMPVYSCVQEKGVLKSPRKRLLLFTVHLKPFSCFYIPLKALKSN